MLHLVILVVLTAGKQKRKKPSMISDSDDDFDNAFDSLEHHTSSTSILMSLLGFYACKYLLDSFLASDICEQPLSTDNQFLNAYKGLTLGQCLQIKVFLYAQIIELIVIQNNHSLNTKL